MLGTTMNDEIRWIKQGFHFQASKLKEALKVQTKWRYISLSCLNSTCTFTKVTHLIFFTTLASC